MSSIKKNNLKKFKLNYLLRDIYNLSRKTTKKNILYWIFLDSNRISDYIIFLNAIPANRKIGIVIRNKNKNSLYTLSKVISKICKKKNFTFLVSSSLAIANAVGADGVHYPKNINYAKKNSKILVTCSIHGKSDYRRAKVLNANLVFISPLFETASNLKKVPLGLQRISLLANFLKCQYSILGGIDSKNIKSLKNRGITSISGLNYVYCLI